MLRSRILYTQSHFRKPVRTVRPWGAQDIQGSIPLGWCRRCGREVFRAEVPLCPRCAQTKGDPEYELQAL